MKLLPIILPSPCSNIYSYARLTILSLGNTIVSKNLYTGIFPFYKYTHDYTMDSISLPSTTKFNALYLNLSKFHK